MKKETDEQLEEYKKYLIKQFKLSNDYNKSLNEINHDVILFLEILDIKDSDKLNEFRQFIEELILVSEQRATILDNTIKFLSENSKIISFKDVQDKTMLYNRILKIKGINDGSTEA